MSFYDGPNPEWEQPEKHQIDGYWEARPCDDLFDIDMYNRTEDMIDQTLLEPKMQDDIRTMLYLRFISDSLTNEQVDQLETYLGEYLPQPNQQYAPSQKDLAAWIKKVANL